MVRFWQNLPISETFWKCCHFFVFYRSVSCKNQDDRELNRKKHGISKKIYFIDFLILVCFVDFSLKIPQMSPQIRASCQKRARWAITFFYYFKSAWWQTKLAFKISQCHFFKTCIAFKRFVLDGHKASQKKLSSPHPIWRRVLK